MTKLDRRWRLARELCVSLNTICVLSYYGLVLDDGERCRLRDGMEYPEALKQLRLLRTIIDEPGGIHSDGLAMRPIGSEVTRRSSLPEFT